MAHLGLVWDGDHGNWTPHAVTSHCCKRLHHQRKLSKRLWAKIPKHHPLNQNHILNLNQNHRQNMQRPNQVQFWNYINVFNEEIVGTPTVWQIFACYVFKALYKITHWISLFISEPPSPEKEPGNFKFWLLSLKFALFRIYWVESGKNICIYVWEEVPIWNIELF